MPEFSRNIAIIIGINTYETGIPPLQTAVNDAQALARLLKNQHLYKVHLFVNQQATQKALYDLFDRQLPNLVKNGDPRSGGEASRLLFYFAGHGIALNGEEGPEGYLIPQDAKLGETSSYFPMTYLQKALNDLPCRHFLGILDCCFAGAFRWSGTRDLVVIPEVMHQEHYEHFLAEPAWQVLTSAAYDQKALDVSPFQTERNLIGNNSPFATALLEALSGKADIYPPAQSSQESGGNGVITATELYLYLRDRLDSFVVNTSHQQTPGLWPLRKHDKGEYLFLNPQKNLNLSPAPPLDESHNPYRGLQAFEEEHSHLFFGRKTLIKKLYTFVEQHPFTVVLGVSGRGKSSLVKAGLIPNIKKKNLKNWQILKPFRLGESPLKTLNYELTLEKIQANSFCSQSTSTSPNSTAKTSPSLSLTRSLFPYPKLPPFERGARGDSLSTLEKENRQDRGDSLSTIATEAREPQKNTATTIQPELSENLSLQLKENQAISSSIPATIPENFAPNFINYLSQWCQQNSRQKLLIIIDQFEELITLCSDDSEREMVLTYLAQAITTHPQQLRFVVTLRSDFEPQFQDTPLKSLWTKARFLVPGMTRAELREAIEEPAIARTLYFQSFDPKHPLVEQLIDEVADMPGVLPLLSFTLSELYLKYLKRQHQAQLRGETLDRAITEADYQELGGVVRSLTQRADREYELFVAENPLYETFIRHVFLRLISIGQGSSVRRRVPFSELIYPPQFQSYVQEIIRRFVNARLLIQGQDNEGNSYIEVAHDALISGWPKLLSWRQNYLGILVLQRRLTPEAIAWQQQTQRKQKKNPDQFLWHNDPTLKILVNVLKSTDNWFNQTEQTFIKASWKKRKQTLFLRWLLAGLVLTGSLLFSTMLWKTNRQSQANLADAIAQQAAALYDNHRELASLLKAIEAGRILQRQRMQNPVVIETLQNITAFINAKNLLANHLDEVIAVSWSPDGQQIASSSRDGSIKLWSATGKLLHTLDQDSIDSNTVAWSPDAQVLAAANEDGTIKLWNREGKFLRSFKAHQGQAFSLAWSPDGKQLISGGRDRTLKLWTSQGQLRKTFIGHRDDVNSVAWSNPVNGVSLIASASRDRTVKLWTVQGQLVRTLFGHQNAVNTVTFTPDGHYLASAGEDQTIKIWMRSGQLLRTIQAANNIIYGLAFSPDGQNLVSGSGDQTVKRWGLDGQLREVYEGMRGEVYGVAWSPDGKMLAAASGDQYVFLGQAQRQMTKILNAHSKEINRVTFSADGRFLASGSADGLVKLWNYQGQLIRTIKTGQGTVLDLAIHPQSKIIASSGGDNTIKLWTTNGRLLHTLQGHKGEIWWLDFSPDGTLLASGSEDKTVKLWNLDGKLLTTLKGHQEAVYSIDFSPDSQRIATASNDKTIKIWDRQGKLLRTIAGHLGGVWAVAFSPDGQRLASASVRKNIRVWDLQGHLMNTLLGHLGGIWSIKFSPDGKLLASASEDQTVKLWNAQGQLIKTLDHYQGAVWSVDFSADSKWLVTGGKDRNIYIYRLDQLQLNASLNSILQQACLWAKDYLKNSKLATANDKQLCPH